MKINKSLFPILIIAALFCRPFPSLSCGPFFERTIFTYSKHPDLPLKNFAKGELGVIQPTYARRYLYIAYRHLVETGFDEDEQEALMSRSSYT